MKIVCIFFVNLIKNRKKWFKDFITMKYFGRYILFFPLFFNKKIKKIKNMEKKSTFSEDKSQGCLLGAFIGDSTGSLLEFATIKIDEKTQFYDPKKKTAVLERK